MQEVAIKKVVFRDLGLIDYKEAWDYQENIFNSIIRRKMEARNGGEENDSNFLLFCEHPHVYTLGKSGSENHLLINEDFLRQKNAAFYKINRGGDITYHGPGQIVGYPIIDLDLFFTDIHKYLRLLEETVIRTLDDIGIKAGRYPGYTGVWLDPENPEKARKICAMGVRTSRWVTMHGFAFNINPDLEYFDYIVPCGIKDKAVTSVAREIGDGVNVEEIKNILKKHFSSLFECSIV